jgi:hypothetical protein
VSEVHVGTLRRRRSQPTPPEIPAPPSTRTWLIYGAVAVGTTVLMLEGFLGHRPQHAALADVSQATDVRSTISQPADSLEVVVSWDLTLSDSAGRPDSIRIKVVPGQEKDGLVSFQAANQIADTLYFEAPVPGQTVAGLSCVAAEHAGELREETCTPWQYVRPTAMLGTTGTVMSRIVIQPSGLQVDPDLGGKCAEWQAAHPTASVWLSVNRTAVPACTGPNAKPTVAQFCAFAVLPDGRKVKTANSSNNSYCEELFVEWSRERYS